jgi:competence protein ComEC
VPNFKSIPFLKILFPYILGIICFLNFGLSQKLHYYFLIIFITWLISFIIQKEKRAISYFKKGVYILLTNALLFLLAFESCFVYSAKISSNHYTNYLSYQHQKFIATVSDIPLKKQKFTKLTVHLNSIENNGAWNYAEGDMIVYVKNDSLLKLDLGTRLLAETKFSYVNEPQNPNEFNYKDFLERKNIFHVAYLNSKEVVVLPCGKLKTGVFEVGTFIKSKVVELLRNSNLSQEAFSICSALLVGYNDEIDSEVMQSFSHAGTLHVLAVSGMHTGVLYGILLFIFSFFDKHDRYKKTKFIFVMFFLVLFVFITGLSPSVLRAALMLTLVLFGKTFYKQGNAYNTLLLSAFILLLINPLLIIDAGFLLSYSAVLGIMCLYPVLSKLYTFENTMIQWLWNSTLISLAATLFTLPISLYYFHQFPIWFVFSNLLIIPLSMLLMLCSALLLVFYKLAWINHALVYLINLITTVMLKFAQLTDNPHFGFIDLIPFSKTDALFLCLIICAALIVIATKRYSHVIALCCIFIFWLSFSIYNSFSQKMEKEFIVFHVKQKQAFALRVGQTVYGNFGELNSSEFQRYVKPYLLEISNLKIINTTANFVRLNDKQITSNLNFNDVNDMIHPDYILVSHDEPLQITTNHKSKPLIIADCSNSYKFVMQLKRQCATMQLPFYWVKENGALQIKL